jgi:hypothetical protein
VSTRQFEQSIRHDLLLGPRPLAIRTPADLRTVILQVRRSLFAHRKFVVRLDTLSDAECSEWETKLNGYQRDCGCGSGALCALAAAGIVITAQVVSASSITVWALAMTGLQAAFAGILFGLVGKLGGLVLAKLRFRRACGRLLDRVSGP